MTQKDLTRRRDNPEIKFNQLSIIIDMIRCVKGWVKEGNVLFNDALNTFYLRLYGVRHMGKGSFR